MNICSRPKMAGLTTIATLQLGNLALEPNLACFKIMCMFVCRNFYVSQIDFTNPEAVKWYQAQLQRAVDLKFHGWMYDYGEYTPSDSVSHDGTSGT